MDPKQKVAELMPKLLLEHLKTKSRAEYLSDITWSLSVEALKTSGLAGLEWLKVARGQVRSVYEFVRLALAYRKLYRSQWFDILITDISAVTSGMDEETVREILEAVMDSYSGTRDHGTYGVVSTSDVQKFMKGMH